ncbi:DUF692 domain-containing protein [Pontibacter sp. JAM-7]|uniref:HvfB family MNIO-type RiPP peptide maturase n=1 Tax=Pontibacter sp. JAM-7 TaxID=3366581 RepID=UPI003AF65680
MKQTTYPVSGAGLGFRRCMLDDLKQLDNQPFSFLEVAPENWMTLGGRMGKAFKEYTQAYPFMTHGLSLSIAGPTPLDMDFLHNLKAFFAEHNIRGYSEHLSYCSDDGHLYDLMPIPFTEEAVRYVANRIRIVQDVLDRPLAMENVSYYAAPGAEMSEQDFLLAVLEEADCQLLLDINNIYVNSVNHCYDPEAFLRAMPAERVMYMHIAGHYNEADDLIVDTHGADVIDPVWQLLDTAYDHLGVVPTLLERDFNIPPLEQLMQEVGTIVDYQSKWQNRDAKTVA